MPCSFPEQLKGLFQISSHESLSSHQTLTDGVGDTSARIGSGQRVQVTINLTNRAIETGPGASHTSSRIIHEPRSPLPTASYFAPIAVVKTARERVQLLG